MKRALDLARSAQTKGEVPVGAVVVLGGQIAGEGENACIAHQDPTAHAEMLAIRAAATTLGNYRLNEARLYVTLEPCIMCAGAILNARIKTTVFAARDERFGAAGLRLNLLESPFMNHQCQVKAGVMENESRQLLQDFFKNKR